MCKISRHWVSLPFSNYLASKKNYRKKQQRKNNKICIKGGNKVGKWKSCHQEREIEHFEVTMAKPLWSHAQGIGREKKRRKKKKKDAYLSVDISAIFDKPAQRLCQVVVGSGMDRITPFLVHDRSISTTLQQKYANLFFLSASAKEVVSDIKKKMKTEKLKEKIVHAE
jgi:hypothetical protein